MPTLKDARDTVRKLSLQALDVTRSETMTTAEQVKALDGLETDIKVAQKEVQNLEHLEEKRAEYLKATTGELAAASEEQGRKTVHAIQSLGRQFVESAGYKALIKRGVRGGDWNSGQIELKTLLSEGTAASPGPGFAPVGVPTVLPGVVDIKLQPLVVSDLIPQGTTSTPLIRYMVESAITNAAATTAEGALAPESALAFTSTDETLHEITTFLPVTDLMLEDWEQLMSYIDGRLRLFVQLAEQAELLTGSGSGTHMTGILNRSGLAPAVPKGGQVGPPAFPVSDNAMDAIYRQITQIRMTAFMEPDAIVSDPVAWQGILLAKNLQGAYYANGPFADAKNPMLWGKPVATTPSMPANEALVGSFALGAQMFRKGGLTVEASNSHSDFFQRRQTAIRADERVGLAVYRPGAFGVVTGL
jgi:HK97 family phage major capsid protein